MVVGYSYSHGIKCLEVMALCTSIWYALKKMSMERKDYDLSRKYL